MRRRAAAALAAIACVGTSGCATILHGSTQRVAIESSPAGARATVLPEETTVVTPATVALARKRSHTVRFELAGYRTTNGYLDPMPSSAMLGNAVLGGLIGMLIDMNTGAAWTQEPDPLRVLLQPAPTAVDRTIAPGTP